MRLTLRAADVGPQVPPRHHDTLEWPFRQILRELGLTSNQVWGPTKTDHEWSEKLQAALTASRRADLRHSTTAAYVHGLCLQ